MTRFRIAMGRPGEEHPRRWRIPATFGGIRRYLGGGGLLDAADGRGRWGEDFVRQVRERVDLVELVSQRVALRRAGRDWVGLCPFHEERTPSFHVSPERQMFHCFGCGAGGDAISFAMRADGLDFRGAVEQLAARAGVPLPERRVLDPARQRRRAEEQAMGQALADAARFFRETLLASPEASDYLRARGIAPETAERFGLGLAPAAWDGLLRALVRRGHRPEVLQAAGLIAARPRGDGFYDRFRGRLVFPIWDERGTVVAFGGRSLDGEEPKYLNSPETPLFAKRRTLYGLHLAREAMRRAGRAMVVEGYMDAIAAHQAGFAETVASLGTALSAEQAGSLARLAERVLIAYDADAAGVEATRRGLERLQATAAGVFVVGLPAGEDPDEFLRLRGREALGVLLDQAEPLVEYLLGRALQGRDPERLADRLEAARAVARVLAATPDPVARAAYGEAVARRLLLDPVAYAAEIRRLMEEAGGGLRKRDGWHTSMESPRAGADRGPVAARSGGRPGGPAPGGAGGAGAVGGAAGGAAGREAALLRLQETIVALMVRRRDWTEQGLGRLGPGAFADDTLREIARYLAADLERPGDVRAPGERILDHMEDPAARQRVAGWLLEAAEPDDPGQGFARVLDDHERLVAEMRLDQIRRLERSGAPVPAEAVAEKLDLLRRLQRLRVPAAARQGSHGDG